MFASKLETVIQESPGQARLDVPQMVFSYGLLLFTMVLCQLFKMYLPPNQEEAIDQKKSLTSNAQDSLSKSFSVDPAMNSFCLSNKSSVDAFYGYSDSSPFYADPQDLPLTIPSTLNPLIPTMLSEIISPTGNPLSWADSSSETLVDIITKRPDESENLHLGISSTIDPELRLILHPYLVRLILGTLNAKPSSHLATSSEIWEPDSDTFSWGSGKWFSEDLFDDLPPSYSSPRDTTQDPTLERVSAESASSVVRTLPNKQETRFNSPENIFLTGDKESISSSVSNNLDSLLPPDLSYFKVATPLHVLPVPTAVSKDKWDYVLKCWRHLKQACQIQWNSLLIICLVLLFMTKLPSTKFILPHASLSSDSGYYSRNNGAIGFQSGLLLFHNDSLSRDISKNGTLPNLRDSSCSFGLECPTIYHLVWLN